MIQSETKLKIYIFRNWKFSYWLPLHTKTFAAFSLTGFPTSWLAGRIHTYICSVASASVCIHIIHSIHPSIYPSGHITKFQADSVTDEGTNELTNVLDAHHTLAWYFAAAAAAGSPEQTIKLIFCVLFMTNTTANLHTHTNIHISSSCHINFVFVDALVGYYCCYCCYPQTIMCIPNVYIHNAVHIVVVVVCSTYNICT